jgi:hypothetical protein
MQSREHETERGNSDPPEGERWEEEVFDCPEGFGTAKVTSRYHASLGLFFLVKSDCQLRRSLEKEGVGCGLSCGLEPK